jgi:hypothetical protein
MIGRGLDMFVKAVLVFVGPYFYINILYPQVDLILFQIF